MNSRMTVPESFSHLTRLMHSFSLPFCLNFSLALKIGLPVILPFFLKLQNVRGSRISLFISLFISEARLGPLGSRCHRGSPLHPTHCASSGEKAPFHTHPVNVG